MAKIGRLLDNHQRKMMELKAKNKLKKANPKSAEQMSKIKIKRRKDQKLADFERHPARCINCNHFVPPMYAKPNVTLYRKPSCGLHKWDVELHSICKDWLGLKGETLEN